MPADTKKTNGDAPHTPENTNAQQRAGRGALPSGYERVNSAAPVWLVKKDGVMMEGVMVGRFLRKGDQSKRGQGSPYFYQFEVINNPVMGTVGSKTEGTVEEVPVAVGQIISVDESEALRDLEPYTDDGGKYQVCLVFGKKQTVKGTNRTFWPVEIGRRVLTPPSAGYSHQPPNGDNARR